MFLKSLQMQGFKSFPDKITIEYNRGITAIVGPNGSGKSNIVDAIRWVLGEQSTKTLRGTKMEDVIFGGTLQRPQVGFAEVSLVLDNSEGDLPVEYSEVTVTRRYYRSGESEYYINRGQCRLKDINELFMNTGLGRDGYSMIGQGKIAEVLSVKSEDRRAIFEEAAGISKYRYRKLESERKLESTEENLIRLRDILAELEDRVEPLRVASERAKKYLDYREERRRLEIDVWLSNIGRVKDQLSKIEADSQAVKQQLAAVTEKSDSAEKQIDEIFENTALINSQIEQLRTSISEADESAALLKSELAVVENDALHGRSRIEELKKIAGSAGERTDGFDRGIAEKAEAVCALEHGIEELLMQLDELGEQSRIALEEATAKGDEQAAISAKLMSTTSEQAQLKISLQNSAEIQVACSERKNAAGATIAQRKIELANKQKAMDGVKEKIQVAQAVIDNNMNIIGGYEKKLVSREDKLASALADFERRDKAIFEKRHRESMLSDMEKALDGYAFSVKKVMSEASRGRLTGMVGPISSLIKADEKYSVAVETAIGGAMQHIVTSSESSAKAAITMLKNENAGRATFLPLDVIKGYQLNEKGLSGEAGFVGIASELAQFDAQYRQIIESVCGRCAVTEDLDSAVRIAKKYSYRFKLVTLDGQVVNPGGSLTGGSQQKNIGLLSRKNEIERLSSEITQLSAQQKEEELSLKKLKEETEAVRAALAGANAEALTAKENKLVLEGELGQYEAYIGAITASITDIEAELSKLESELQEETKKQRQFIEREAALCAENTALEERLGLISGDREKGAADRELLQQKIADLRLAIAEDKRDIEAHKAAAADMERQKQMHLAELSEREQEILKSEQDVETLAVKAKEIKMQIQTSVEQSAEKTKRIAQLGASRDELEKEMTALRAGSKDTIAEKEKLIKEDARLEGKRAAIEGEYDSVVARLWEEYELTVTAAEELRRPVEDYAKANRRINELKSLMKNLGNVNIDSIEEYKTVKERYEFYTEQISDLEQSKADLQKIIEDLTEMMKSLFKQQFVVINQKFGEVFKDLFGGGSASLELSDPSDVLESGIDIKVNPPGKLIKSLQLLSGGEQTFVAIALYFAILAVKPVPFCILDEIEAALDDVNVVRFANYVQRFCEKTQFIIVTHRRGTMEASDMLYGVTMQEKGISKLLAINVSDIEKKLSMKIN